MDITDIKRVLNGYTPIAEEAWTALESLFKPHSLKRNEYLFRAGDRPHSGSMLLHGVLRVFYTRNDGVEYNKNFFVPGMSPTPITSLISKQPSALNFQALTDAEVLLFNFDKFLQLTKEHPSLNTFYRRLLEQLWMHKERQEIMMVTNDATTNYKIFQEQFPNLEQQIPQYHIASYLGITPIQLSRIRAALAKNSS
ncbi:MAG: Crp/Fnr family transcriptional regulator [Flavipsychrobacter sp.]